MIETSSPLHILLVDNNENERLLFRRAFQKSDISCKITECSSAEQVMEQLGSEAPSFDTVVVDYNLSGISGMDLCMKLLDEKIPLPLVLLAETGCEKHVAEALKAGVPHYIIKDPEQGYLELLPMSLINAVHQYKDCRHYEHIEKMIQNKKRIADTFWESIPDTAGLIDTDENVLMINKAGAESLGTSVNEIIGRNARDILFGDVYEFRRSKWNQVIQTGKICHFEDERDGKFFETWFCPVFNEKGKVESIAVFAHDITERKKTEKALRQSEEKFRLAMEVTNDALWDWNLNTNEVYRNPRHATMLGYEPHELTVSRDEWEKRIHPDDKQSVLKMLDDHLAGKTDSVEIEYRLKTKTGDYVWILGRGKVVEYNDDDSPARAIGTNIDITERKKAEEASSEYQTLIRGIMDNSGSIVVVRNPQGQYIMVNKEVENLLGMESGQIIGKTPFDIYTHDKAEKILSDDRKVIESRNILKIEDQLIFNCDIRTFEGTRFPLINSDEEVYAVCTIAMDITERKKQYERDETILNTCIDGFWVIDTQGKILEVNDAYCRMSRYSRDELLTMYVQDVEAEEKPEETIEHIRNIKDKGFHRFESRHRCKDGTIMDLDISATYLDLDGGRTFTFFRDITAAKRAEKEVRKFKTIVDKAGHGVGIVDLEGDLVYVNESFAQMHQYTIDELIGKNLSIFHSEEQMDYVNLLLSQIKQKGGFVAEEVWHKKRDNTVFPTLMSATLVTDEGGGPLFMAATAIDITKHKKAEELLRYSEERYRSVVEDSPVLLCSFLPDGEIVFANAAYCTYFGKSSTELIGSNFRYLIPEADRQAVIDNIKSLTVDSPTMTHEHKVYSPDGQIRWQRWTNRALFDERGRLVSLQAFGEDITDRKNMEEALQESELRYHTLFEILPVGVGLSKLDGRIIDVNSTFQQMLGYTIDEISRISAQDTYYNPEDRPPFLKRLQQDGSVRGFEVQLKRKNGTIFLADLNVTIMKMHGESVVVTVVRDITEKRRMERALAESEEKYRTLVQCARDPIATIDKNGTYLFMNKTAARRLTGRDEDLAGKTLWDFFPKEIADRHAENIRRVIETEIGENIVSLTTVQDQSRWYNTTIEPLRDDRGNVVAAIVIARDVDDIKRAQEQIQKLSSAVGSSISGIAIGDAEGNLTYVNHAFLEMWGYDDENKVLGRNAVEFWEDEIEGAKVLEKVQNNGSWIGELKAKRKNGSSFDVQVCGTLVKDENGRPISMMGSFTDITESKRREEELTRYRGQMARAEQLASLGTLSATIAHQLTQPLTVIRLSIDNALDELEASSSSQTVIRRLKDSVTQVSNITSIIERFRNFARKSSGRTFSEVSLKAVAVRIAGLLSESARSASITFRIRNMDDLPSPWMNENDLEQLFFALMGNAIQAADGKKSRQLIISGAMKEKYIELRLSDDCGGIAPENIDKIFEPFFTTKPRGQGTGLGLCIVKDIVSRIGGHVHVESKFGKGTTFIINIPVEKDKIS